jgi:selenocysteine lyase/cysteine desulfurase
MAYDVERVRGHFPSLAAGVAYFDGPGGTQVPDVVGEAMAGTLTAAIANRGTVTAAEQRAEHTVLVAVTGASNLLGTRPDLRAIADLVHGSEALLDVDGVHLTPHAPIDVSALGADFFSCSPYKFLGPHCGVLAADPELLDRLAPDKLLPATNEVPERFELGTLPYELMAATSASVDFLAGLDHEATGTRRERVITSMTTLEGYEDGLRVELERRLTEIPAAHLYSCARQRTPTLVFDIDGRDSADVYRFLAARASTPRPARSTPSRRRGGSVSATTAPCAPASLRTRPPTTPTASSRASPSSPANPLRRSPPRVAGAIRRSPGRAVRAVLRRARRGSVPATLGARWRRRDGRPRSV